LEAVFGVELVADEVPAFLAAQASGAGAASPPANYRDAVVSQVGQRLYEMFFAGYTRKQWGREPETLSAELAKRVPVRVNRDNRYFSDQFQGVPRGGYTRMVEAILDHPGISLVTGADWFSMRGELQAGLTVYTGELDRFFDYEKGKLEYRSLKIVFETLEKERHQEAAVVNYPNDYAWTRISEFKWLTGERSEKTTICYEFPTNEGEPYYIIPDAANGERREEYMRKARALESAGTHLFIGRLAEYRYYDMDQAIKAALDKTAALAGA
jgi:UDP-galactopyranose mutase